MVLIIGLQFRLLWQYTFIQYSIQAEAALKHYVLYLQTVMLHLQYYSMLKTILVINLYKIFQVIKLILSLMKIIRNYKDV